MPLAVYVLWHPDFADGPGLARTLYDWLSGSTPQLRWSGLGVPVGYRTGPAPRPISTAGSTRIVIVPLVDEHWVADRTWREFLKRPFVNEDGEAVGLTDDRCRDRVLALPTMLHPSAARIRELAERNFLIPDPPTRMADTSARKIRLRRQVTQAIGRWMLVSASDRVPSWSSEVDTEAGARQVVFISHAKADGLSIARQLREEVMNYGQLRPFFDENDLPLAVAWRRRLEEHASHSDSLIAVVTDAYASRPWCRAELLMARTPRPFPYQNANVWMIRPVVAVDALEREFSTAIPELGSVPVRRWNGAIATEILDRLVLERLLTECHARIAASLEQCRGRHYVTWVPDLPTVASLVSEVRGTADRHSIEEVIYSGHGLRESEISRLTNTFTGIAWRTYEDVRSASSRKQVAVLGSVGASLAPVAFSVGNPPDVDLYARGVGPEHLHEAIVRVGRMILELGYPIAWGGMATRTSGSTPAASSASTVRENFTVTLREISRSERLLDAASSPDTVAERPLFYSYASANSRGDLDAAEIANDLGLCAYATVPVPDQPPLSSPSNGSEMLVDRWRKARGLSEMRRCMVQPGTIDIDGLPVPTPSARIIAGGKISSYEGVLPGVIEEALYSLQNNIRMYVVGGFGGAAGLLADALERRELPRPLSWDNLQKDAEVQRTINAYTQSGDPEGPQEMLKRLSSAVARPRIPNGLSADENHALATTTDIAEIVRLIRKALSSEP
jgi:hypothetical protein